MQGHFSVRSFIVFDINKSKQLLPGVEQEINHPNRREILAVPPKSYSIASMQALNQEQRGFSIDSP